LVTRHGVVLATRVVGRAFGATLRPRAEQIAESSALARPNTWRATSGSTRRYGADTQVLLGPFFEIVLVIAFIGTAVVLYPIVKRQNDGVAQGPRRRPCA
jgi:hypothetical protein